MRRIPTELEYEREGRRAYLDKLIIQRPGGEMVGADPRTCRARRSRRCTRRLREKWARGCQSTRRLGARLLTAGMRCLVRTGCQSGGGGE